jgi:hypothetical protein
MIILIFILPIVTFEFSVKIKVFYLSKEMNYDLNSLNEAIKSHNRSTYISNLFPGNEAIKSHNRTTDINNISSGRTTIWSNSLNIIYEKKLIFGNGPQSDRLLLSNYYKNKNLESSEEMKFGTNSSNAIIYSILCGGVISLFFLLQIYYLIFAKLINFFFRIKKEQKNFLNYFLITSLCFLIFRSIFENGFALFGVDFCLLCLCYYILNLKKLNLNKSV